MDAQSWIAESAAAHSSERNAAPVAWWIAAGAGAGLELAEGIAPADAE